MQCSPETPVAPGSPFPFAALGGAPPDGLVTKGPNIVQGADEFSFTLQPGTYQVDFNATVAEAGQAILNLSTDGLVTYSCAGRATPTCQIVISTIIVLATAQTLQVLNPPGNDPALTRGGKQISHALTRVFGSYRAD